MLALSLHMDDHGPRLAFQPKGQLKPVNRVAPLRCRHGVLRRRANGGVIERLSAAGAFRRGLNLFEGSQQVGGDGAANLAYFDLLVLVGSQEMGREFAASATGSAFDNQGVFTSLPKAVMIVARNALKSPRAATISVAMEANGEALSGLRFRTRATWLRLDPIFPS
jgi:hypothetical protein